MLLTRTLQHVRQQHTPSPTAAAVGNTAISSSSSGGDDAGGGNVLMSDDLVVEGAGLTRRELAVQLLLFLQLLEHWVIAEAVAAGVYYDACWACWCLAVGAHPAVSPEECKMEVSCFLRGLLRVEHVYCCIVSGLTARPPPAAILSWLGCCLA